MLAKVFASSVAQTATRKGLVTPKTGAKMSVRSLSASKPHKQLRRSYVSYSVSDSKASAVVEDKIVRITEQAMQKRYFFRLNYSLTVTAYVMCVGGHSAGGKEACRLFVRRRPGENRCSAQEEQADRS